MFAIPAAFPLTVRFAYTSKSRLGIVTELLAEGFRIRFLYERICIEVGAAVNVGMANDEDPA
jgi:hypothetical protein